LAANAKRIYGAPYNYKPTHLGDKDAVIRVWGNDANDVMHVSRICSKSLLQKHASNFQLKLNFDAPAASGFPAEIWSSKYGDRQAFTTHSVNWLDKGVWGKALQDLKIA
jgi:hypothetical protein